ncbi:uncharacterized protein N7459_008988 [Penicillium hispanicum]|uniref:uncharacterized protein n=1 Tax=Penicillium hispanicum TaxID=1080232 RepID=UPI00253FB3BD|nr:uncharacterized protein N7459_008988 [Penicillium hispanicum]KAJ5569558.1 hypothetical protein N7459_008988 [Penicillium hispanicum]
MADMKEGNSPGEATEASVDHGKDVMAVQDLARQFSQHSTESSALPNPFMSEAGSEVDPTSPSFQPEKWIQAILNLARDEELHLRRITGVGFRGLNVFGSATTRNIQSTVGGLFSDMVDLARNYMGKKHRKVQILHDLNGLVCPGELLVVLGPPGSGCSTFLKTITGETHGLYVDSGADFNYHGISFQDMHSRFKGEAIYTAEQDVHFPQLTVGTTLEFAAFARAPRHIPGDIDRQKYASHLRDVLMAMFGISHTVDTKVGNEFIRGVSGGERKRVSIAEAALNGSPLQCWDNSTRGLDSANALEFCKTLKLAARMLQITAAVAIYQAPQAAYDLFDKVLLLYEGRQIFFGPAQEAQQYFLRMGFECPERQTVPDFLTSMTSPTERRVKPGFENQVPQTPDDFARIWRSSRECQRLLMEVEQYSIEHPLRGPDFHRFQKSRSLQQSKFQRQESPFTLSYLQQVNLCVWRGFKRVAADPSLTITEVIGNICSVLVISSIFYNLKQDSLSFYSRGALLFFAIVINAFSSALEILTLYAQRAIVEKHARYALYHPSAEAFASILTGMPFKVLNAICFNLILYFMTNLNRTPGAFFFFLFASFLLVLVMSSLFRTIASLSRTLSQALSPTVVLMLALVIYSGFPITTPYMHGWSRWINYIDPIAYGLEALMINEFHHRNYTCSLFVPSGPGYTDNPKTRACAAVGSVTGQLWVDGDAYIESNFKYAASHKWRDIVILIGFWLFFTSIYLIATDYIAAKKSKGEVLIFARGRAPKEMESATRDEENKSEKDTPSGTPVTGLRNIPAGIARQTAIFHWQDVCYDIKVKGDHKRLLDSVDGWDLHSYDPLTSQSSLIALMGVSGAGKTTLLDVLASRVTIGDISGKIFIDGKQRDCSFQRKTGYAQQQDLHLETSTIREALNFSAILRQPKHIPRSEKLRYVEEVLQLLELDDIADAVVGVPGEGLNVEQRKRLTIGVELVAKPELLLFLDEPTSGLDSQTSWSILTLLQKLRDNGQAILCTIHQPSAMLLQQFDRVLLLASGGKTVYFGPIGASASTMLTYFERNGGSKCPDDANPAEYMLEVIGAAPGSHTEIDWTEVWRQSPERDDVHAQLEQWERERPRNSRPNDMHDLQYYDEYAAPMHVQLYETLIRIFQQYWRTPSYICSKIGLVTTTGLFIGFSFYRAPNTQQGLQNQMFGLFMLMTIFSQLVQQIMPQFVTQRALYEARERPSKTYSWVSFMLSNILVEIPWSLFCSVLLYFTWYYPIGLYRNAEPTDTVHMRGALAWLLVLTFILFSSTFAHMAIAAVETAETGGNLASLCFSLILSFCGVLAGPSALPRFWIFMYRVSPFHYLISGLLSASVAGTTVRCAAEEYLHFDPPTNMTCGEYLKNYIHYAGGYVAEPLTRTGCAFCPIADTNTFLRSVSSNPDEEWMNFGLMWVYIVFNIWGAVVLYWIFRVPKKSKSRKPTMETRPLLIQNAEETV